MIGTYISGYAVCKRLSIDRSCFDKFAQQSRSALHRGIDMQFTFEQWWTWWQIDNRWARRGCTRYDLVMARYDDIGHYHPDNVYCCTAKENCEAIDHLAIRLVKPKKRRAKSIRTPRQIKKMKLLRRQRYLEKHPNSKKRVNRNHHLAVRGDKHPKSHPVLTPKGRFGSIALAAEAYGLTRAGAKYRADKLQLGWSYPT